MVSKGDIVLVPFPFTDLSQTKVRPAVTLWSDVAGADVLLCFITSQPGDPLAFELLLDPQDSEFPLTGLQVRSRLRVTRMATIERRLLRRRLGKLGEQMLQRLDASLKQALQLS
ncbi:type II toxin-antitoxin system PemK/MazF family toxin [Gloeobacter kilaueensis]|uniref:Growth inhibitor n=1 Tax=Gloeobacter kilaueensis (strain ATCC BAA-2537 / CCAP 1431/1 / ULC 316 / JS1) TaxID=1183438 RepID=U5QE87_GLOK1|nr:growth inhibitor [Gloeobacter kilaueensis JS1]